MSEWIVAGQRVAPPTRGGDEFRGVGSSVLGERTGHLMKISHIASRQGISVFVRDDGRVFHTYSAYGAGPDVMLSTYRFLDLTPLGRQRYINDWPWHDTYGAS